MKTFLPKSLVAVIFCLAASLFVRAQTGNTGPQRTTSVEPPVTNASFAAASVSATPGSQCKLNAEGSNDLSAGIPVFADQDGFARFFAKRATPGDAVEELVLNCIDPSGKSTVYLVDLRSEATFASRPLNLDDLPGVDRPALAGDPLSYTQSELLEAGYGLRPDPATSPSAYARWLEAASRPGRLLQPKQPAQGMLKPASVPTATAPNWVGAVMTGAPNYTFSQAEFSVPKAIPGTYSTSTAISIWNGLGGYGSYGLIQGGIQEFTSASAASYIVFREYCCGDGVSNNYSVSFTPKPGDLIFTQEWYCDTKGNINLGPNGGYGCSFVADLTTGAFLSCVSATNSTCASVPPLNGFIYGKSAEFIIELEKQPAFTLFTPTVTISGGAYTSSGGFETVATDPTVTLLTDFTDSTTKINVTLSVPGDTNFQSLLDWENNDLIQNSNSGISPAPGSALDGYWGNDSSQHVNFIGTDGHVHELYIHPGAGWVNNDLTQFSGGGITPALESALDGYWGSDNSQHVNFIGSDGHVHELYIHPGAGWVNNDLIRLSGGGIAPAPGSALDGYWGSDSSQHVNFIGTDGHVHELYIHPGAGWANNDLTQFAGGGVSPVKGSRLDAYWGSDSSQHVNFIGTDGHIHELYTRPGMGWVNNDLTAFSGGGIFPTKGSALHAYWGSDSSQHVNFIGTDGHVHELYTHPGAGWVNNDLTQFSGGGISPALESALDGYWGNDNSQHVNYIGTDGHVHELYIHPGAAWVNNDLTLLTASEADPVQGSALDGYWGTDSSQHVNFIGTDGHVHELYIGAETP